MVDWVDRRIDEMLTAPRMWGACHEAVELQVLTLLQVRALAVNAERELAEPRRVLEDYVRLLGERFGTEPPRPVHELVDEDDDKGFVELLRALSAALSDVSSAEGDEFFTRSFLGIDLQFAPGQFLSTQAVTGYYEDFRRATRSLARLGTGRTGRVEKSIEMATDFVLESMQITPLNGVPARARLELGTPYGQLELKGGRVFAALDQMMDAAARADEEGYESVLGFGGELDVETRTRALVQTMRVLPRGGIEEVTIGGSYLARAPVRLRKLHAPKLMAAVAGSVTPSEYDQTALIRAIDLDRGSISHGNSSRRRALVYFPAELSEHISQVGIRARIVGKHYAPHNGQPFVIAEQIDILSERVDGRPQSTEVRVR